MNKCIKRVTSFLIIFLMVFGMMPWQDIQVHAAGIEIKAITVNKTFDSNQDLKKVDIEITGENLRGVSVIMRGTEPSELTNRYESPDGRYVKFTLTDEQIIKLTKKTTTELTIGGIPIKTIDENSNMPQITGFDKKVIKAEEELIMNGISLNEIKENTKGPVKVTNGDGGSVDMKIESGIEASVEISASNEATIKNIKGDLGSKGISFDWQIIDDYDNDTSDGDEIIKVNYFYENQFRVVDDIDDEHIEMTPNMGTHGSTVKITSDNFTKDYDVFFVRELTDNFMYENLGKETVWKYSNDSNVDDIILTKVPSKDEITSGTYKVVLTNKINPILLKPGEDLTNDISQQKYIGDFIVQEDGEIVKIKRAEDDNAYDEVPTNIDIVGLNFNELNIPALTDKESNELGKDTITLGEKTLEDNNQLLSLEYDINGDVEYKVGKDENGKDIKKPVKSITRKFKVIIGSTLKFQDKEKQKFNTSEGADDSLAVITSIITNKELLKERQDIIMEVDTIIEFDVADEPEKIFKQRPVLEKGFQYMQSELAPTVTDVIPDEIAVEKVDGDYHKTIDDIVIGIEGSNFIVTKYVDKNDNNKEKLNYPQITIGENIRIFKKENEVYIDNLDDVDAAIKLENGSIEVLNNDQILEGTSKNETGDYMVIKIPKGQKIKTNNINMPLDVQVRNPKLNSPEMGVSGTGKSMIKFVTEFQNLTIDDVKPNKVSTKGGEEVIVTGSNFKKDVKVIIDGKIVDIDPGNITPDSKKLTFKAPANRKVDTYIMLINPDGGMDSKPFRYVKTDTQPKITDFSPKRGSKGTLVVIKGEGFLQPDASLGKDDIDYLIGSKVFLEELDVNDYYINPDTERIELKSLEDEGFDASKSGKILSVEEKIENGNTIKKLKASDYYYSVLLNTAKDGSGDFYTIKVNLDGKIVISNLEINEKYNLYNENKGDIIKGDKEGGGKYTVHVNNYDIELENDADNTDKKTLYFLTPYQISKNGETKGEIIGNRVKVITSNQIEVIIPKIDRGDGYYDLAVINPDSSYDTKLDEQGFEYRDQPQSTPQITNIIPSKGSTTGGYSVKIEGSDFKDNGESKTTVSVNGVQVKPENVKVSPNGKEITFTMPPYDGDLSSDLGIDSLEVPVVIVNPDGAPAEYKFTYRVPKSHPKIFTPLGYKEGENSAAGGNEVEISGEEFRFMEPYTEDSEGIKHPEDLNGNEIWDDYSKKTSGQLKKELGEDYEKLVTPILPKVYFGDKQAKVIDFQSDGYLKVIAPEGSVGSVDVYVVNNDYGISNKEKYTYIASNPQIDKIISPKGRKHGNEERTIVGSGFVESNINVYKLKNKELILEQKKQALVRFGEISNKEVDRYDNEKGGLLKSSTATVNLEGNLKVFYNGVEGNLNVSIKQGENTYSEDFKYDYTKDGVIYIPVNLLKNEKDSYYDGYELIRIEVSDNRLLVGRGYSPEASVNKDGDIDIKTPSYHTIGEVPVTVINPDGGEAKGKFEYTNPTTNPKITDILKEGKSSNNIEKVDGEDARVIKVNYKGGNTIDIEGEDFAEDGIVYIGDKEIPFSELDKVSSGKLTFKMPDKGWEIDKPYMVTVSNLDGASANSKDVDPKPIYIIFKRGETPDLSIESVTPNSGPSKGGTRVEIIGKSFRNTMEEYENKIKIYFGDGDNIVPVPESDIISVSPNKIVLKTPPHIAGTVSIKIVNPDENITELEKAFTYISRPKIVGVFDLNDKKIDTISVDGGEEVKLKGSDFMEGARVIFNPVLEELKEKDNDDEQQDEVITIEDKKYILKSGNEASDVKVIDSQNITLKTPAGKIGTYGVLVINTDASASNVYERIVYDISQVQAPGNVEASLVYDKYIKVTWDKVEGATSYEIYVVTNDSQTYFVGNTDLTSFIYKDLESDTKYKFIVKALGEYGLSKASMVSNEVETGRHVGPEDKDGELSENTSSTKVGDTANIIIGTDDYDDKEIKIDLTKGPLAGSKEVVVSMPAKVVSSYSAKDVTIIGSDFYIKFNPTVFNVSKIDQNRKNQNAGVRFKVSPNDKTNMKALSNEYILSADAFVGKDSSEIDYLKSKIQISLDLNVNKANMRRNNDISLRRYDEYNDDWIYVKQRLDNYSTAINTTIDKLGRYSIIANRR